MKTMIGAMALLGAGVLAGCSDSDGGGGGGGGGDFDQLLDVRDALDEEFGDSTPTSAADLPDSGTAAYSGVASFGANGDAAFDDPDMLGAVDMEVTFGGGGAIEGSIHDFATEDDADIEGELSISNGSINSGLVGMDVGGTLTRDGVATTYFPGGFEGSFYGPDGAGISASGTLTGFSTAGPTTTYGIIQVGRDDD